jgi:hypothetical protein
LQEKFPASSIKAAVTSVQLPSFAFFCVLTIFLQQIIVDTENIFYDAITIDKNTLA